MKKIKNKSIKTNEKGITLVMLIITIIILLILSAISIGIALKGNLFEEAQTTIGKVNEGQEKSSGQEEDIDLDWNNLPGTPIKSTTTGDTTIEIEVIPTNIKSKSFRINARGTNSEGDELTFILKVDGKGTIGERIGNEVYWDVIGLTPNTEYPFTVIAKDDTTENSVTGTVTTLPNTKPEVTVVASNITLTTATITANGTDADGDTLIYNLTIDGKTYGPSTKNTWNITGLTRATTYPYTVTVSDGIDTVTKAETLTTKDNAEPVIVTNSLSSKTTTEIQILAKATDADGDKLTYTLYTSTSQNGTYTSKATLSSVTQNTQVTLKAENLSSYTTYWWYITVSDGRATVTSSKQSTKTYCPGTGLTCNTNSCNGTTTITTDCTRCDGDGLTVEYCQGGSSSRCSDCAGKGTIPCPDLPYQDGGFDLTTCAKCGAKAYCNETWRCDTCGTTGWVKGCDNCGYNSANTVNHENATIECPTCGGDGTETITCEHGRTSPHNVVEECLFCNDRKSYINSCRLFTWI